MSSYWRSIVLWPYFVSFFHTPPAFDTPHRGSPSQYCNNVWHEQTRIWVYQMVKSLMMIVAVSIQYRLVTHGETDRQTSCDSIVPLMHTRRAIKIDSPFAPKLRPQCPLFSVLGLFLTFGGEVPPHKFRAHILGSSWLPTTGSHSVAIGHRETQRIEI